MSKPSKQEVEAKFTEKAQAHVSLRSAIEELRATLNQKQSDELDRVVFLASELEKKIADSNAATTAYHQD